MAGSLAAALVALQTNLPDITKGKTAQVKDNQGKLKYTYGYADLHDISTILLPLLTQHGLAWITRPTLNPDGVFVLAYRLVHAESGQEEAGEYPLPPPASAMPQAVGGAITYARRYALCAVTGVAPEGDDDDAAAAQQASQSRGTAQRQNRPANRPQGNAGGRTAQRATAVPDGPPLPNEPDRAPRAVIDGIAATLRENGVEDREEMVDIIRRVVDRADAAGGNLTPGEAGVVRVWLDDPRDFSEKLAELLADTEGKSDG